jgi:hypothetical protein
MDWPNFFRGIFYSLLPKDSWRSWRPSSTVDFARSAMASGFLEFALFVSLLARDYLHFLAIRTQQMEAATEANQTTQLYFFLLISIEYAFHPLSLILLVLSGEGVLRLSAAFLTDEVVPSLPIKLAFFVRDRLETRRKSKLLGPEVPDLLEQLPGKDGGLRICAQQPKEGWRASISVAVDGEFYQITQVETGTGQRPFTYRLRKLPAGTVIRGMYRYDRPAQPQ